jgi:hypothetical protein
MILILIVAITLFISRFHFLWIYPLCMMVLGGVSCTTDLSKSADIDLTVVCWPWNPELGTYWFLQIVGFFLGLFAISIFDD